MADASQYPDSAHFGKTAKSYLTAEDLRRCTEIDKAEVGIVSRITSEVAAATGVPHKAILGVRRDARTVQARQLVMYIARREGLSFERIGTAMRRDHSTVVYGVRAEEKRRGEA